MRSNHPWLYMQLLICTVCGIYGRQEKLLFSTSTKVKEVDMDTGVVKELANHSSSVYSIAYDVKERYVYFPRLHENVIERFFYPIDENVTFEIVVSTIRPFYVAFDSENSHLYWTEYTSSGKIMRSNSDGSSLTTIINEHKPVALALDTHNSKRVEYRLHNYSINQTSKREDFRTAGY
ncbi:unnamed protein product [Mytilus coruscus]|uniref:Uncharacterized protein n=1 Tax=Mytilus coruscus TaxID=42192 RepID=A0A6J8BZJ1_MYTCO|nr:unnamed protein product [Mytilus coruscus]